MKWTVQEAPELLSLEELFRPRFKFLHTALAATFQEFVQVPKAPEQTEQERNQQCRASDRIQYISC